MPRASIRTLVARLDVARLSYSALVASVFAMGVLRAYIEILLLGERPGSAALIAHLALFFVAVFLVGGVILSWLGKTGFRSALNAMLSLWWVTLLTPVVDALVLGRTSPYAYESAADVVRTATSLLCAGQGAGVGLMVQLLGLSIAAGVFAWARSGSPRRGLAAVGATFTLVVLSATPGLLVPVLEPMRVGEIFGGSGGDAAYVLYYLCVSLIALVVGVRRDLGLSARALRASVRLGPAFIYGGVAVLAYVLGVRTAGAPFGPAAIVGAGLVVVGWLACWQSIVMVNDVYDVDIDRTCTAHRPLPSNAADPETWLDLATVFLMASLVAGAAVAVEITAAFALIGVVLSALYSVPPLALKRRLVGGPVVMGIAAGVLAFGAYGSAGGPVSGTIIVYGAVLIVGFTIGVVTKDARDAEGDRAVGAVTLFTLLGPVRGRRVAAALIATSALLPTVAFPSLRSALVFAGCAVAAGLLFGRTGRSRSIFPIFALEFAYVGYVLFAA